MRIGLSLRRLLVLGGVCLVVGGVLLLALPADSHALPAESVSEPSEPPCTFSLALGITLNHSPYLGVVATAGLVFLTAVHGLRARMRRGGSDV